MANGHRDSLFRFRLRLSFDEAQHTNRTMYNVGTMAMISSRTTQISASTHSSVCRSQRTNIMITRLRLWIRVMWQWVRVNLAIVHCLFKLLCALSRCANIFVLFLCFLLIVWCGSLCLFGEYVANLRHSTGRHHFGLKLCLACGGGISLCVTSHRPLRQERTVSHNVKSIMLFPRWNGSTVYRW